MYADLAGPSKTSQHVPVVQAAQVKAWIVVMVDYVVYFAKVAEFVPVNSKVPLQVPLEHSIQAGCAGTALLHM